jgi:hypothetical protein
MNQNERDGLAIYLGLQEFEVTLVEVEFSRRRRQRIKVVHLARRSGTHRCPDCGREHASGLFEEAEAIRIRDCSIGDFETHLHQDVAERRTRGRWGCRDRRPRERGAPSGVVHREVNLVPAGADFGTDDDGRLRDSVRRDLTLCRRRTTRPVAAAGRRLQPAAPRPGRRLMGAMTGRR